MSTSIEQEKILQYYKNEINAQNSLLKQNLKYSDEYSSLQETLKTLPDKTEYDSMLPIGTVAFIPGKIVHTNEILVLLGEDWFVEQSAKQASRIAQRRQDFISDSIKKINEQIKSLKIKAGMIPQTSKNAVQEYNEEGDPIIEIKEEFDEEAEHAESLRKAKWEMDHTIPDTSSSKIVPSLIQPKTVSSSKKISSNESPKNPSDTYTNLDSILGKEESELIDLLKRAEVSETGELSDDSSSLADEDIIDFSPISSQDLFDPLKFENYDDDEDYQEAIESANISDGYIEEVPPNSPSNLVGDKKEPSTGDNISIIEKIPDDEFSNKIVVESIFPKEHQPIVQKKPSLFKQKLASKVAPPPSKILPTTPPTITRKKSVSFNESVNTITTFDKHKPPSSLTSKITPILAESTHFDIETSESDFLKPVSTRYFSDLKQKTSKKSNLIETEKNTQKSTPIEIKKNTQKSTPIETEKNTQTIKKNVIENTTAEPYTEDMADYDILSKEVSQAYYSKRKKVYASESFKDAKIIAEKVLSNTPGVTLVDEIQSAEEPKDQDSHSFIKLADYEQDNISRRINEIPLVKSTTSPKIESASDESKLTSNTPASGTKPQKISRFKAARLANRDN
ncbi:Unconventional prefoldin RPB5 interactor [Smittium mucronatum]|uniref:Unconventional prefoldin RPB5 interactor n=1 Tax=Smittium mucronatum TaxID=133383 RepID=A0A1R0GNX5_9FUNG|nr:Unconventional prefoldin RPB5 interactor [Smittium mucronatum]